MTHVSIELQGIGCSRSIDNYSQIVTRPPQFNNNMVASFIAGREYDLKINSSTAHRSTQGFKTRRVRVLGPVEDGKLPILDLTDPRGETEKRVYVKNIIEVDGKSTGQRAKELAPGDIVLVDRDKTVDGTEKGVIVNTVDRKHFCIRSLLGGKTMVVPKAHVRKTTQRKLQGRRQRNTSGQLVRTIRSRR